MKRFHFELDTIYFLVFRDVVLTILQENLPPVCNTIYGVKCAKEARFCHSQTNFCNLGT
jgi:hypothetical protein